MKKKLNDIIKWYNELQNKYFMDYYFTLNKIRVNQNDDYISIIDFIINSRFKLIETLFRDKWYEKHKTNLSKVGKRYFDKISEHKKTLSIMQSIRERIDYIYTEYKKKA